MNNHQEKQAKPEFSVLCGAHQKSNVEVRWTSDTSELNVVGTCGSGGVHLVSKLVQQAKNAMSVVVVGTFDDLWVLSQGAKFSELNLSNILSGCSTLLGAETKLKESMDTSTPVFIFCDPLALSPKEMQKHNEALWRLLEAAQQSSGEAGHGILLVTTTWPNDFGVLSLEERTRWTATGGFLLTYQNSYAWSSSMGKAAKASLRNVKSKNIWLACDEIEGLPEELSTSDLRDLRLGLAYSDLAEDVKEKIALIA